MYEDDAALSREACGVVGRSRGNKGTGMEGESARTEGRLRARPAAGAAGAAPVGLRPLGSGAARDGYLYVPAAYRVVSPAPLVVLMHGAGEDARDGLALLRQQADAAGLILLALSSRGPTWDLILGRGRYGADVAGIDRALESTFSRYAVDPACWRLEATPTGLLTRSL
jgi:phospholipase/carboxylesterase